jgi:hypothetical protein
MRTNNVNVLVVCLFFFNVYPFVYWQLVIDCIQRIKILACYMISFKVLIVNIDLNKMLYVIYIDNKIAIRIREMLNDLFLYMVDGRWLWCLSHFQ